MSLIVFAFHFNRGRYLKNLVESVARNIAAPLVIIDDESTDPASVQILRELGKTHEVIVPSQSSEFDHSTGGLHANMHFALKLAQDRGADLALMLQDDMQVVRPVTPQDLAQIRSGFERPHASYVSHCCFLKSNRGVQADNGALREVVPGLYEREVTDMTRAEKKMYAYSDTGFFSVPQYHALNQPLLTGERANESALLEQGMRMGIMTDPIMHWLPMPVSFSARKRRWSDRVADHLAGADMHPIRDLSGDEQARLRARDKTVLPYAEDFLMAPSMPRSRYWSLRGGRSNLLARQGWRRRLAKLLPK